MGVNKKNQKRKPAEFFENQILSDGKIIQKFDKFKSGKNFVAYLKQELIPNRKKSFSISSPKIVMEFPIDSTITVQRHWLKEVNKRYKDLMCAYKNGKYITYKDAPHQWSQDMVEKRLKAIEEIKNEFKRLKGLKIDQLDQLLLESAGGSYYRKSPKAEKVFYLLCNKYSKSKEALQRVVYGKK